MIDGLKDKHRNAIIEILASNDLVERVILFGSRAMETFTPDSDVDIALFGEGLTMTEQGRLATALEESAIPQRVDLILYDQIDNDPLREHIRRHGIEWYRRPKNTPATRLHLRPSHRLVLEALLRKHLPDIEVWAYGNRVSGKSHEGSDLNLVLRAPGLREIPDDLFADFNDALRDSNIPFLVEARDWGRLPETFHREIEAEHVVLVDKLQDRDQADARRRNEWSTATIEEIAEKVAMGPFGSSIKVETFVPEGIPIISGQHLRGTRVDDAPGFNFITEEHATKLAKANVYRGDIVFTHAGNIGQAAYIPEHSRFSRYVVSQRQFYLRCNRSKVLPEFVALYFKSPDGQHQLLANSSQVGVPSIARPVTYLRTVEIPLPPLSEQKAIAHILGTLDDKIELNRRMNETLEEMVQAVFQDWFIDFGPTRAKMEGRTPYLAPKLWNLFPDRFVNSQLGKIPEGWEVSEIGKEVDAVGGATPSTKEPAYWNEGKWHWATPKDLSKLLSPVLLETERKITDAGIRKISSGLLPRGTVLLSSRAPIGYLAITETPTAVNQGFIAMVCKKRLPNVYVLFWCYENLEYIKGISGGSTFAEISKKAFRPIPVTVPSAPILTAYEGTVRPIFSRIVANVSENRTLANLRDTLLPKLISGEIRAPKSAQ